jgi:hypothetical protein
MKINVLALAVACLGGAGCVVVSHRDDVNAGDPLDAQLYVTWETKDSTSGARIDCRSAGADTVRVSARNSGTGRVYVDLFDCAALSGTTFSLTAGDYFVTVDLVTCGTASGCPSPAVVSAASTIGPFGVWSDDEVDLGHFVFLVQ